MKHLMAALGVVALALTLNGCVEDAVFVPAEASGTLELRDGGRALFVSGVSWTDAKTNRQMVTLTTFPATCEMSDWPTHDYTYVSFRTDQTEFMQAAITASDENGAHVDSVDASAMVEIAEVDRRTVGQVAFDAFWSDGAGSAEFEVPYCGILPL